MRRRAGELIGASTQVPLKLVSCLVELVAGNHWKMLTGEVMDWRAKTSDESGSTVAPWLECSLTSSVISPLSETL